MRKRIFTIITIMSCVQCFFASDSIRVNIIGEFKKGQKFKIHTLNKTYLVKFKYSSICGYYFYMPINNKLKDGDLMPILIEIKKIGKYRDTKLECKYISNKKHFIIGYDDFITKKTFIVPRWSDEPIYHYLFELYWNSENDKRFLPEIIPFENKLEIN